MKFKSLSILAFVTLFTFSELLLAQWTLCTLPSHPTASDIPADAASFWVISPVFGFKGAIIHVRKENNPITLLPDLKFYLPAPYDSYHYSSEAALLPDFSTFKWNTRCWIP